jgi:hypothetical protein
VPGRETLVQRAAGLKMLCIADLLIMPTSAAKPAWEAVIAVQEAA